MNIVENIEKIKQAKNDIRTAINNNGGNISESESISGYADAIKNLSIITCYKCTSVNPQSNGWTGIKAILDKETHTYYFDDTHVYNFSYTDIEPVIDGVYTEDALTAINGKLFEKLISPANMTSNKNTTWEILYSGELSTDYPAWKAFDGDLGGSLNGWFSPNPNEFEPQYIGLKYTNGSLRVSSYGFSPAWGSYNNTPQKWQFQGSNDGVTWTTIDYREGVFQTGRAYPYIFNLSTIANFQCYRIYIQKIGTQLQNFAGIGEFFLYGTR